MPELPEVECLRQSLLKIKDGRLSLKKVRNRSLRVFLDKDLFDKKLSKPLLVNDLFRHGKYLFLRLETNLYLKVHLGMSGVFKLVDPGEELKKHDHVVFNIEFSENIKELRYEDPRRFGSLEVLTQNQLDLWKKEKIGPDILSKEFSEKSLTQKTKKLKTKVYDFLLNQKRVGGLGNIYVNEVLYFSKVSPFRTINKLSPEELKSLVNYSKKILKKAVKCGGTTLRDYKNADSKKGTYQNHLSCYSKEGQPCGFCGNTIEKTKIGGRGVCLCKSCQK